MGSISSLSNYYQLSNLQSSTSGNSSAGSTAGNTSASLVQTLAQALSGSSGAGNSSSDAYLLNLSPAAQALMGGSSGNGASTSTAFTLNSQQEKTIQSILAKYKGAPYDQTTFDSIQNDLKAAGLGPQQLSAQDQVTSFNSTSVLLGALNGTYASLNTPGATQSSEATKANNYMQGILSAWKAISTSSASGASPAASASLS